MPGGVGSMKGEKQMIYKRITFKADPFSYDLEFDDRITLVGGDSGTGKTVLYEMLEDVRLTDEYRSIKLFNYKSDDFSESVKKCRDSFIVIDNADILINDEVRRFINFEFSNQYMLFLRNCDGLNVSDKSFKVLKLENHRIDLSKIEDEKINTVKRNTKKFINYDRKKRLGLMRCSKIKVVKYFWGSYNGLATKNLKAQKKRNCLPVPQ